MGDNIIDFKTAKSEIELQKIKEIRLAQFIDFQNKYL